MATKSFHVKGLKELGEAFKLMRADMQDKTAKRAASRSAGVIKGAYIRHASMQPTLGDGPFVYEGKDYQPGLVAKNVISKNIKPGETPLTAESIVLVRSNKKNDYVGRLAVLLEYGTVIMEPKPFARPAWEEKKNEALNVMINTLDAGITSAAKKAAKIGPKKPKGL